jgi:putative GTP pyrophosphokinase
VLEGPEARIWDDEYEATFTKMKIATVSSERMYTSVHYVVDAGAGTKRTAEIQVRTLAQEYWGEVDHAINYPYPCGQPSVEEQIKVLARVTSSCTRLVDSIFFALEQEAKRPQEPEKPRPKEKPKRGKAAA